MVPGLHHGLDKVKLPILTISPQHGYLLWYLVAVQRSLCFAPYEQPFFQVISLFLHLFPFNVRCWTFDLPAMPLGRLGRMSLCLGPVSMIIPLSFVMHGRRVFDVHFSQSILGKNNLALKGIEGVGSRPVLRPGSKSAGSMPQAGRSWAGQ
jgi:hypothetical protein